MERSGSVSQAAPGARTLLVSVCMPSFNHARFLPAAIESVLAQTYPHIELVIADDGSTDQSLEIARSYAARCPGRVRVVTHAGRARRGISATANLAFEQSTGAYWCGLCSDDAFMPDKIARQVTFLEEHPAIGLVYGPATVIDDAGRILGPGNIRDLSHVRDPLPHLLQGNWIWGQTAMIRRECFERVGLHDERLMYSDWELWIRIAAHYRIAFLASPVTYYRVHTTNSSLGQPVDVHLARHLDVMRALERKAPEIGGGLARPSTRALIELQLAYLSFCANDRGAAARAIQAALTIDHSVLHHVRFLAGWLYDRQSQMAVFTGTPSGDFVRWFVRQAASLAAEGRWRLQLARFLAESRYGAGQLRRRAWHRVKPLWLRKAS